MRFLHPFVLTATLFDGFLVIGCGTIAPWLCIGLCW